MLIFLVAEFSPQQPDWLTTTLFESPGWAIAALAIVWAVLRIVGRRTANKKLLRGSWLPLGLIVALLLTAWGVTTEREKLGQAIKDMVQTVEDQDLPAFREAVLPGAMTRVFDRELTRDQVEAMIDKAKIDDLLITSSSYYVDGDTGASMILVRADGSVANAPGIEVSRWVIRWERVDGRWRAQRLECLAIGPDAVFNRD